MTIPGWLRSVTPASWLPLNQAAWHDTGTISGNADQGLNDMKSSLYHLNDHSMVFPEMTPFAPDEQMNSGMNN